MHIVQAHIERSIKTNHLLEHTPKKSLKNSREQIYKHLFWPQLYETGKQIQKEKQEKNKYMETKQHAIKKQVGQSFLAVWVQFLVWIFYMPQVWPKKIKWVRVPTMVQQKRIQLGTMRLQVWSLALLSGWRIQCCCELWCRSQMRLGSAIAVVVAYASSCSSDLTTRLGTSICRKCGTKKKKKKNQMGQWWCQEIRRYLKNNKNENMTFQKSTQCSKSNSNRKVHNDIVLPQETRKTSNKQTDKSLVTLTKKKEPK